MNEELTREVLEAMERCGDDIGDQCSDCPAKRICHAFDALVRIKFLAAAMLAEMDKPKVWDSIHTTVDKARIIYYAGDKCLYDKEYTRELPKTRAKELAVETVKLLMLRYGDWNCSSVCDTIEATLNKYAEELKGEA